MEKTMTSHVTQVGASTAQQTSIPPFPAHGVPIRSRHVKKPKPLEMLKDFTVPLKTWPVGFFSQTSLEVEPV